ncbi:methyl-accepting chemotaxis protein [Azospirillum canadense]|uniref:methyl-accepting chemotaxis protein n=1 Tax=Azospirillum canadense TaxID=403962 RepID=UPI0029CAB5C3|nr:methyl-accepting chemotaxis protein [Azospirillum canadense]
MGCSMKALLNMTVTAKANFAFTVILMCAAGLGAFSVNRLSAVNDAAAEVRDNWLPSVGLLAQMTDSFVNYRVLEGAHVTASSKEEMAVEEKTMAETIARFDEQLKGYATLLTPGYEKEVFRKFAKNWEDYRRISTQTLLPLSRENRTEDAGKLYRTDARKVFREAEVGLRDLVDFNTKQGKQAANRGEAIYGSSKLMVAGIIGVVLLICLLAAWMIVGTVSKPIGRLTGIMNRLAGRDLAAAVEGTERKDELGAMARAVQVFKEGLIEADRLAAEQTAEQEAKQRRASTIDGLIQRFEEATAGSLRTVASAASELDATARSMEAMAQQANGQAMVVASAAEQTSVNVQTVASATDEMVSSIREIGTQVARSSQIAGQAVAQATQTHDTVRGLAEAAQKIGDVVGLITNIASQTNLLALNATIEAARAGEAGKGFAVVAGEVKHLANQTARATEDIAIQIAAIQSATDGAVQAIGAIGSTIVQVNDIATGIASAIEEQGAATNEISRNVQQAAAGTQEVSTSIAQVTIAASETGSSAGQVKGAAGELAHQSEALRRDVEQFLASIKAA